MLVLTAEHEGRRVRVLLDVQPEQTSAVYVATSSKADPVVADICALTYFELTRSPR